MEPNEEQKQVVPVAPVLVDKANETIEVYKQQFSGLEITGIEDVDGYKAVVTALKTVKQMRFDVENKRKELVADSIKHQKLVNGESDRIKALIEPLENDLAAKKKVVDDEALRIQAEKEKVVEERYLARVKELLKYGVMFNGKDYCLSHLLVDAQSLRAMDNTEFNQFKYLVDVEFQSLEVKRKEESDEKVRLHNEAEGLKKQLQQMKDEKLQRDKEEVLAEMSKYEILNDEVVPDFMNMILTTVSIYGGTIGETVNAFALKKQEEQIDKKVEPAVDDITFKNGEKLSDIITKDKVNEVLGELKKHQFPNLEAKEIPLHQLVDAEKVKEVGRMIKNQIPGLGFALLIFEFNKPGQCNYLSNADRSDMITAMFETATRLKNKEDATH